MKLQILRSVFSQLANYLTLEVEENGTKITFDLDDHEMFSFAEMLIDVAYDVLEKSEEDTEEIKRLLQEVFEAFNP